MLSDRNGAFVVTALGLCFKKEGPEIFFLEMFSSRQTNGNWMDIALNSPPTSVSLSLHNKNPTSFDRYNILYNPSVRKLNGHY